MAFFLLSSVSFSSRLKSVHSRLSSFKDGIQLFYTDLTPHKFSPLWGIPNAASDVEECIGEAPMGIDLKTWIFMVLLEDSGYGRQPESRSNQVQGKRKTFCFDFSFFSVKKKKSWQGKQKDAVHPPPKPPPPPIPLQIF